MDYRIEQLRYLLREDPSSRIFYQLGELLRREGEAEEAVEILRTGLDRHPRYVSAWVCLGRSQRDLRALEEARQSFQTALDFDRENPVAARLLGETAVELDDWLGAVKALKLTRALAGADDELDAQITMVENHLDQDGRLDRPRPVTPPGRCLDVVNLSADDPFSDTTEETAVLAEMDDVFATTEVADDPVTDEEIIADESEPPIEVEPALDEIPESIPEAAIGLADESVADESPAAEDIATAAINLTEPDSGKDEEDELVATDSERIDDSGEAAINDAPIVDESSVGAWSTSMSAAGVSGEEAWTEPSGEIVADDGVSSDESWAEPGAAMDAVETVADEPLDAADTVIDEAGTEQDDPAEISPEIDQRSEDVEPEPVAPVEIADTFDDPVLQIETHEFDSIEATHPIVVEKREADAEEQALAEADELAVSDEARDDFQKATGDDLSGDDIEIADKRHELEHGVPLPTMTLAKLALQQDDRPLAMATLESLIERDPTNTEAVAMLDELSAREATFANERLRAVRATTKIAALQGWLDAVRLAAERRVQ